MGADLLAGAVATLLAELLWTVVPDSINASAPEITWSVGVQRTSSTYVTYWINITNQTNTAVDIEARYAILA